MEKKIIHQSTLACPYSKCLFYMRFDVKMHNVSVGLSVQVLKLPCDVKQRIMSPQKKQSYGPKPAVSKFSISFNCLFLATSDPKMKRSHQNRVL
jgi:hypothetical protein